MSQGTIFHVRPDGALSRMSPGAPPDEDHIQRLIARYPELIQDSDGDLLLIRREQPIADSETGGGRWSLDHLFVTRSAVPVLVEVKRASDTRLRREVVGQILDYAANGVAYWQPGRIPAAFEATCLAAAGDPIEILGAFLGDSEPENFWGRVDDNFRAGRIKLVFVADVIPPELARIVEFLNDQMRADVRAIELNWFVNEAGGTSLVPRTIGESQRAIAQKSGVSGSVTPEEWIDRHMQPLGQAVADGARAYVRLIQDMGGSPHIGSTQGSIIGSFRGEDGAGVYPLHLWRDGAKVSPSFTYVLNRPRLADEATRRRHYDAFVAAVGPLSTTNLNGSPGFNVGRLADPHVLAALTPVARAFVEDALKAYQRQSLTPYSSGPYISATGRR